MNPDLEAKVRGDLKRAVSAHRPIAFPIQITALQNKPCYLVSVQKKVLQYHHKQRCTALLEAFRKEEREAKAIDERKAREKKPVVGRYGQVRSRSRSRSRSKSRSKSPARLTSNKTAEEAALSSHHTRLIFVLDRSSSMGTGFKKLLCPACYELGRTVKYDSGAVVLFGATVSYKELNPAAAGQFLQMGDTKLEHRTDICGGLAEAVKRMDGSHTVTADKRPILHFVIFMSDGADTVNKSGSINGKIEKLKGLVAQRNMKSVFFSVGIGSKAQTRVSMLAKTCLDNVYIPELVQSMYYARKPVALARAVQAVVRELKPLASGYFCNMKLHAKGGWAKVRRDVNSLGFTAVCGDKDEGLPVLLNEEERDILFITDKCPSHITLSHCADIKLSVIESEYPPLDIDVLSLVRLYARDLRLLLVTKTKISPGLLVLSNLVSHIPGVRLTARSLTDGKNLTDALTQARNTQKEVRMIQTVVQSLISDAAFAAAHDLSSNQEAIWLLKSRTQKYGVFGATTDKNANVKPNNPTHAKAAVISAAQVLTGAVQQLVAAGHLPEVAQDLLLGEGPPGELCLEQKQVGEQVTVLGTSSYSGQSSAGMLTSLLTFPDSLQEGVFEHSALRDYLAVIGLVGYLMDIDFTDTTLAYPWTLNIRKVSLGVVDTCSALLALDNGFYLQDQYGARGQHCLFLRDPANPAPFDLYVKSVFAQAYVSINSVQHPDMFTPERHEILLFKALERVVHEFTTVSTITNENTKQLFMIILTLRHVVGVDKLTQWAEVALSEDLAKRLNPEDGKVAVSAQKLHLSQLWGALCCVAMLPSEDPGAPIDEGWEAVEADPGEVEEDGSDIDEPGGPVEVAEPGTEEKLDTKGVIDVWFENNPDPAVSQLAAKIKFMTVEAVYKVSDSIWAAMADPLSAVSITTFLSGLAKANDNSQDMQSKPAQQPDKQHQAQSAPDAVSRFAWAALLDASALFSTEWGTFSGYAGDKRLYKCLEIRNTPTVNLAKPEQLTDMESSHMVTARLQRLSLNILEGRRPDEFENQLPYGILMTSLAAILQRTLLPRYSFDTIETMLAAQVPLTDLTRILNEELVMPISAAGSSMTVFSKLMHSSAEGNAAADAVLLLGMQMELPGDRVASSAYAQNVQAQQYDWYTPQGLKNIVAGVAQYARYCKYRQNRNKIVAKMEQEEKGQMLSAVESKVQQIRAGHRGLPHLFTAAEVKQLNSTRSEDDQLQLCRGGMLKHHCGYESCPDYLRNFATLRDLTSNSRRGIFAHVTAVEGYCKNMHGTAEELFLRNMTEATFCEQMANRLQPNYRLGGRQTKPGYLADFRAIYAQLKAQSQAPPGEAPPGEE